MMNTKLLVATMTALAAIMARAGDSAPFPIDSRAGVRVARATVPLAYSTDWNAGATGVAIALDGETLFSAAAPVSGDYAWDAASAPAGLHTLTFDDGVETLSAQFAVGRGTLLVRCPYAGCEPAVGEREYEWGSVVTASAPAYFVDGLERHACTGWTGTGSVPASGSATNVTFALEQDSTLEWTAGPVEYRLELGIDGQGSLNASSEWCQSGVTKVVTATPGQYWHFDRWEGDTTGCRLTGSTLRAPMTRGRSIRAVFTPDQCSLAVENALGAAWPANGTSTFDKGSEVSAWSAGVVEEGRTRYLCTGWAGTGSAPATGTGTNAVFAIIDDSSLSWAWQTNYLVRVSVVGDGSADFSEGWVAQGSNLVVTAAAGDTAYTSAVWSGDVEGATIDGLTITLPVDGPKDVVITFAALGIGDAVEQPSLIWTTDGDSSWIPVESGAHDGVDAAMVQAGGTGDYAESGVRTCVDGPGSLSFWWKSDVAAGGAGIDLYVDGTFSEDVWLSGQSDWTRATVSLGAGSHTVEWVFWSDGLDPLAAGWLDQVSFPGGETATTPVPVPYEWLGGYGLGDGTVGGFEAAANATAANEINTVWECYVAGLVPTNAAAAFRAVISWKDGAPVITWEPDLNESGTKHERVYTVEGRENLTQGSWGPTNANSHFFRVKVELK